MENDETEILTLESGVQVWISDEADVFIDRPDWPRLLPSLNVRTVDGVDHRFELGDADQEREELEGLLQQWLTPTETQVVLDRFGVEFQPSPNGQVQPRLYRLLPP